MDKTYNPSTALTIMLRLDALALEEFRHKMRKSKVTKSRFNAKTKMQRRGFSLDELCSIHPFKRRTWKN